MRPLRIGTRGSALALWQARAVASGIERLGGRAELITISTRGDRRQDVPLANIGGKGVFVKEIHDALLGGEIDLAVHSAKDMPAIPPDGLRIAAVLPREDPRDALIAPSASSAPSAPSASSASSASSAPSASSASSASSAPPAPPARLGTGSPRRIAQLRRLFPAASFEPIRGNVDTRLRKLDAGEVEALVLACAGLRRLGLTGRITRPLTIAECVPAPGQGLIAIEARDEDDEALALLAGLNDAAAGAVLAAEQAVVAELGGGCQLPLGAFAELHGKMLSIRAVAASTDGARTIEGAVTGALEHPVETGRRLARSLASRGARELLLS